jgi:outer membrane lipoprotein-sorting protein
MIEKKPDSFSDIVDRAAAELQSMLVPPGPPPELLEALLKAASANAGGVKQTMKASNQISSDGSYNQPLSQLQKMRNIIMKNPFKTLTTFAACCLVLVAAYLIIGPMTQSSVAFAEVCAIIQKAKTMVCTGEMNLPMTGTTGITKIKIMSLENGRMREEMGQNMVMIFNMPAGKTLTLSPDTKTAILLNVKGMPKQALQQDFLTDLKKITQNPKAEDLGLKIMDGKEVKGFRVKNESFIITFWADSKSGDPITVEYQQQIPALLNKDVSDFLKKEIPDILKKESKGDKTAEADYAKKIKEYPDFLEKAGLNKDSKSEKTMIMVLSNFQFDIPLDESLFSLTPPEGYKLQEMSMDWSGGSEKDVIEVLRRSADMENGAFPDSITDQKLMMRLTMKTTMKWSFEIGKQAALAAAQAAREKAKGKEPTKVSPPEAPPEMLKEQSEIGNLFGRMTMFLKENEGSKYAGKGVKLGDAQTPIFWYVPKESKQGRVVYGDLSVRDVPTDQLPPDPESKLNDTK